MRNEYKKFFRWRKWQNTGILTIYKDKIKIKTIDNNGRKEAITIKKGNYEVKDLGWKINVSIIGYGLPYYFLIKTNENEYYINPDHRWYWNIETKGEVRSIIDELSN